MTDTNDHEDATLIREAWAATLRECNCPMPAHYLTEVIGAEAIYRPGRLAVVTESVPDPSNRRERLTLRVVRVISREGDVRHTHTGEPMTARDLLAEMWYSRTMHGRVAWRPYGAPVSY